LENIGCWEKKKKLDGQNGGGRDRTPGKNPRRGNRTVFRECAHHSSGKRLNLKKRKRIFDSQHAKNGNKTKSGKKSITRNLYPMINKKTVNWGKGMNHFIMLTVLGLGLKMKLHELLNEKVHPRSPS